MTEVSVDKPDASFAAPVVAVTVFADRARVTRRGAIVLAAGEHRVVLDGLPLTLQPDSVRVSGSGGASILGVDVHLRHQARTSDAVVRGLEEQLREAHAQVAVLDDEDAVAAQRLEFLAELARRSTRSYAAALSAGQTDPARVAELCDALDGQQAEVRQQRRELHQRRQDAWDRAQAAERDLAARRRPGEPDHFAAAVTLAVAAGTEVTLEISYVADGAAWRSAYDVRLDGDEVTMSWFGLVHQSTGEDWPECELRLSTARPSQAAMVPELEPWFLDRLGPPAPRMIPGAPTRVALDAAFGGGRQVDEVAAEVAAQAAPLWDAVAVLEQGATAATYRPERVVAVPADGDWHRSTIAVLRFVATLDYVTAPVLAEEAHLRAKVANTSPHTLPGGRASVFHGGDFVGTTNLEVWAPGEEIELALGIDDRIRVERELVRRTAAKAVLGSTRRRESEHRITVTNHTPSPTTITVLDQLPVSRDDAITVKELRLEPQPAERTDLGVITWVLELGAGESRELHLGLRVEVSRGAQLAGWRE